MRIRRLAAAVALNVVMCAFFIEACSSQASLGSDGRDGGTGEGGTPASGALTGCPSVPSARAECAPGIGVCTYWATKETCGDMYCPCAVSTASTQQCGSTGGCQVPTDNRRLCAPGGSCNEGFGCVLEWCGRSCVCANGAWKCGEDRCDAPTCAGATEGPYTCGGEARACDPNKPTGLPSGACTASATCDVVVRPASCKCAADMGPRFPWSCSCVDGNWKCTQLPPDGRTCGCADAGSR